MDLGWFIGGILGRRGFTEDKGIQQLAEWGLGWMGLMMTNDIDNELKENQIMDKFSDYLDSRSERRIFALIPIDAVQVGKNSRWAILQAKG